MADIRMRVGIDWNEDGIIEWGVRSTDPDNIAEKSAGRVARGGSSNDLDLTYRAKASVIDDETSPVHGFTAYEVLHNATYLWTVWPFTDAITHVLLDSTRRGLSLGMTQTYQVWARSVNVVGSTPITVNLGVTYHSTASGVSVNTSSGTDTIIPDGTWQLLSFQYNSPVTGTYYQRTRLKADTPANGALMGGFRITGMMLRDGTTSQNVAYNSGTEEGRLEDLTKYLVGVDWAIGTTDVKERMPSDSTCTVSLDNSDRLFSPGNAMGLNQYGVLKPNKKMVVQLLVPYDVFDSSAGTSEPDHGFWHTVFSGLVSDYDLDGGSFANPIITITATRSLNASSDTTFSLDADDPGAVPLVTHDSMEVLKMLLEANNITETFGAIGWRIGSGELGITTNLQDASILIHPDSDTVFAVDDIKYVGVGWENESLSSMLRAVVYSEWGWLFMSRDGRISFRSRYAFHDGYSFGTVPHINVDFEAVERTYTFGKDIRNTVSVPYKNTYRGPANLLPEPLDDGTNESEEDDELKVDRYWNRKINIAQNSSKKMARGIKQVGYRNIWRGVVTGSSDFPGGGIPILTDDDPRVIREENLTQPNDPDYNMNIIDWDQDKHFVATLRDANNMGTAGTTSPIWQDALYSIITEAATPAGAETNMSLDFYEEVNWVIRKGKRLKMWFTNDGSQPNTYTVNPYVIRAIVTLLGEEERVTYINEDSMRENKMSYGYSVEKTLFHDEQAALDLAQQIATDYGEYSVINSYVGDINSINLTATDQHERAYRLAIYMRCGSVVELSESFVGMSHEKHLVIGEKFSFQGGTLVATPTLINLERFTSVGVID